MKTAQTWLRKAWHWLTSMRTALILLFIIFILSVSYLVYGSYNPFLYFRF